MRPKRVAQLGDGVTRCMIALLMFAACSPPEGDRPPSASESVAEQATDAADTNRVAATEDATTGVGAGGPGDGQAQGGLRRRGPLR